MKRISGAIILLLFLLLGCEQVREPETVVQPEAKTEVQAKSIADNTVALELNQLYIDFEQDFLALNPINGIFRDNMSFNDQHGDFLSDEYFAKSKALDEAYLKRITAFDPSALSGSDRVSYDIFKYNREQVLQSYENGSNMFAAMMPVNQMASWTSFFPMLGSGQTAQPFNTVEDYDNWIKRAKGFNTYVDQAIMRMQQGVEQGVVMPTLLMKKVIPQLEAQVNMDVEKSPFYLPITNMPESFSDEDKARLTAAYKALIKDDIMASYAKLGSYIKNDYINHTRETHGIGSLPNGKVAYNQSIEIMTTTTMDAETIHEIGLKEAERLFNEMKKVKDQVGFEGDMQTFFNYLKTDPKFYYETAEELMQGYEDLRDVINPKLDMIFNIQPKTDYVIRPVEAFRERSMAAAQYFPGEVDGSRPGVFYVNTYDLTARPIWMMNALSIHEASPGHHFQVSLNREAGDLPPFRRFAGYSAYSEGWGLYSETLGIEMGLYEDPYQYFGMLYAQIWRANRLVVDTGIHAKGWTREQAIDFMKSNSPVSETDVVAEVERYMAMPGQALSYMIGRMKLEELRKRAETTLGDKFDLREFHKEVLADGAMPMAILEQKIDRWIESVN
ncbi:MAG: hypothetical protein ACI9N9_003003 [Enterobacterales bacterium]|jgi:uncharacterized protein (DUF885 family)